VLLLREESQKRQLSLDAGVVEQVTKENSASESLQEIPVVHTTNMAA